MVMCEIVKGGKISILSYFWKYLKLKEGDEIVPNYGDEKTFLFS